MIIWCLKGNNQGANFYKKHGGDKIKERDYTIRKILVREVNRAALLVRRKVNAN